jgi:hypothetical protein
MLIAYCIGCLATVVPVPAGLAGTDPGLVGVLILYGFPATASVDAVFVNHAASIWVPGSAALSRGCRPGEREPSSARPSCQRRSWLGGFRLAEATGTETVDRPGAETDRAFCATASSVVETALELDGGGPGWGALRSSGLRFVVGTVFMRALISGASSQVRDR